MLIAVLAVALTACANNDNPYTDDSSSQESADNSLDNLVNQDVSTNDLGNDDFIELGDMI